MSALRDYQHRVIRDIYQQWRLHKRSVLLAMPTGSGKTRTFSEIARHFVSRREQVLMLCHREELLLQSQKTLETITGQPVGLIQSDRPLTLERFVQCASVQTLVRRLEAGQIQLPQVSLVIVDEAHLSLAASYITILKYFERSLILGVTATPCRLDGRGFDELYQTLVLGPEVSELIGRGYLADYHILTPETFLPSDDHSVRLTGGDFNIGDLAEHLDRRYVAGRAVDAYQQYAQGKRCVVFAINIEHSKAIVEHYRSVNIPAEHIDGETPAKLRQAILERFRQGQTLVLSNVNLFTEGFDLPEIEVVQLCRPTQSVALHLQMVGRGLRPKRGRKALILDHAGNCLRLGGPKARRQWTLQGLSDTTEPVIIPKVQPSISLPPLPKRQVEIFETPANMAYMPASAELETQLAHAAYKQRESTADYASPRHESAYPAREGHNSPLRQRHNYSHPPQNQPLQKPRVPVRRRKPSLVRQVGKAALELAELLEGILNWMRSLWMPPQPKRRRPPKFRRKS